MHINAFLFIGISDNHTIAFQINWRLMMATTIGKSQIGRVPMTQIIRDIPVAIGIPLVAIGNAVVEGISFITGNVTQLLGP
mgnify:CR=1 FL=1